MGNSSPCEMEGITMRNKLRWTALAMLLALTLPLAASAASSATPGQDYYTIRDEQGNQLLVWDGEANAGDEYIAGDNKRYEVIAVDEGNHAATAAYKGEEEVPDIFQEVTAAATGEENKRIALYFTHTDEAYTPSDGAESVQGGGSIVEVGEAFAQALEEQGLEVSVSDESHEPHDAGAYRRSRRTALDLIKSDKPNALFDIHRDGVPKDEYLMEVDGTPISKVRIVVGRNNQNAAANREFAKRIKAVADKTYPGLIKDIYIGKGGYNQDLMPKAILFEMGTYDHLKDRAIASTKYLADVVVTTLYGGTIEEKDNSATPAPNASSQPNQTTQPSAQPVKQVRVEPMANESKGAGTGWIWFVVAAVVLGGIFLWVTAENGFGSRLKDTLREMGGSVTGKHPKK